MTDNFSQATVVSTEPYIELNNRGQIKILPLTEETNRLGRAIDWSNIIIPDDWKVMSRRQAIIQKEGQEYRIYDGDREKPSGNGMFLNQTRIHCTNGMLLKNGMQLHIGQDPRQYITLTYHNPKSKTATIPSIRSLSLKGLQEWPVELGRAPNSNSRSALQLDAPTVSRLHATIDLDSKGNYILKDRSSNGTFVNGKQLEQNYPLNRGDTIQIGPFTILFTGEALDLINATNQIRVDAKDLVFQVKDKQGAEFVILNHVTLAIEPGQLVALVGGSGAGKSTLMKALLGINPITSGQVLINGDDLRQNWAIYRSQVGYVPQDDIIHPDLTVEEVLTYACQLRLPPDTNISQVITQTLEQIKLSHVRHTLVAKLSGGQRKRVSIGVELLADPKLFFLDEPTSGLDPGLDKEMMGLLREQANRGRTVVLVTHATDNIDTCDRIAFMGLGGSLCYYGPSQEALGFFQKHSGNFENEVFSDFADIYIQLNKGKTKDAIDERVNYWSASYKNSDLYTSYIKNSLSPGKLEQQKTDTAIKTGISPLAQLILLSQRYWKLVNRDRLSLILTLLSGPAIVALTALPLRSEQPLKPLDSFDLTQASLALRLLFIFSCIAIWIGLSNSIREIVKEAAIYFRERLLNLALLPYIVSKLTIRSFISLIQTILITIVVLLVFDPPKSTIVAWPIGFAVTTFLTLLASTSLSLMISAIVKTENEGNGILPLIMMPQIIFSGVLFTLEGWSAKVSWLMLSRWSIGAYGSLADVNAMAPKPLPGLSEEMLAKVFEKSLVYDPTWKNLALNWGVLLLHTLIYAIIAVIVQRQKDIFK